MRAKYFSFFLRLMPILLFLSLVIIVYYPVFFMGYWAINQSDALHLHLPNNYAIAESLRHGKLPLWNPNLNLGQPIIDGVATIFHPAILFYLVFNPWLANTLEVLLGLLLVCLGMWYFLRQQHFEIFPAIAGTFVYVLSGPVFFLHSYHFGFMAILVLPWCLWVFHQHDRTGHPIWLWIAAALCILATQGLDLDTLLYLYIGLFIDRLVSLPAYQRKFYVATWITIFLLSAMTGLSFYLPLYEWLTHSSRLAHSYRDLFNPNFSNMLTAILTNQWLTRWPYEAFYFYFGPAMIWLFLAGLVKLSRVTYISRYFLYSLIIPIFYIIMRFFKLSLGPFSTLDLWRPMFIFCISLAMVVAIGVRNILQGGRFQRVLALLFGLATAGLAIWAIVCGMYIMNKYSILLITAGGILITIFPWPKRKIVFCIIGIFVAIVSTLMGSAIIYIRTNNFCILSRNSRYIKNLSFYRTLAKVIDGQEGHGRVSILNRTDNTTSLAGLKTIANYKSIYNEEMENSLCSDGLINRNNEQPYWMVLQVANSQALSFYGVQFLISLGDLWPKENSIGWIERADLSWFLYRVWENKHYIGRAYLVSPSGPRRGGVKFLEDTSVSVVLEVEVEDGERIVLADLNYPGWEAFVDSKSVPTEVYHGCLRSVRLSKGKHIVHWRYNGRVQRIGLILSTIVLFILVVFLIIFSVWKRKARRNICLRV